MFDFECPASLEFMPAKRTYVPAGYSADFFFFFVFVFS